MLYAGKIRRLSPMSRFWSHLNTTIICPNRKNSYHDHQSSRSSNLIRIADHSESTLSYANRNSSSSSVDPRHSNICRKLSFIGGGKMAEAMIHALTVKGVQSPGNILVFDVHGTRLDYLRDKYGVSTTSIIQDTVENSDAIILAVKPQNVTTVASMLTTWKPDKNQLLLSIVAGCTLNNLESLFQSITIVRSMPNTPAMVLEGITVWTAAKSSSELTISLAKKILRSIGEEIEVSDENYLDMATAVSGSGPAYVFLTMEAMIDAAVHVGFPRDTATKLVTSTIRGSATYAMQSGDNIPSLRNNVSYQLI